MRGKPRTADPTMTEVLKDEEWGEEGKKEEKKKE